MCNSTCANAIFCCIVFHSKSRVRLMHPHQRVCLYFHRPRKVRTCSVKVLRSHGIQESAHFVFFTLWLLYLIRDWFSDTLLTSVMHSPFVAFLIEVAAAHGLLVHLWFLRSIFGSFKRFKSRGPDLTNRLISPFIIFNSHRGPKIRMIRPRNRAALTRSTIRHVYFA